MKITNKEQLRKELAIVYARIIKENTLYENGVYKDVVQKHVARRDKNNVVGHLRDKILALKLSLRINARKNYE